MSPASQSISRQSLLIFVLCVFVVALIPRVILFTAVPTFLYSDDAPSYLRPALVWAEGHGWTTDGRRGPVYSLFLAAALKVSKDFNLLVWSQHLIGCFSVVALALAAWRVVAAPFIVLGTSLCLAIYSLPIELEHVIRNETLLLFFCSIAILCFAYCSNGPAMGPNLAGGAALGIVSLLRNVYLPLLILWPLVLLTVPSAETRRRWTKRIASVAWFAAGFGFVQITNVGLNLAAGSWPTPQPQTGILLYGRVAQFTVLDAGIYPEIKQLIREDILEYRTRKKLDNNIIVKRTAVPKIASFLHSRGEGPRELNRVCRDLALEAIRHNLSPYIRQVLDDLHKVLFRTAPPLSPYSLRDLQSAMRAHKYIRTDLPTAPVQNDAVLMATDLPQGLKLLNGLQRWCILFNFFPVFLALAGGIVVTIAYWGTPQRAFWLVNFLLLASQIALLCTIGRPASRYLIPALPQIFLFLTALIALLCGLVRNLVVHRRPDPSRA
jgi:hypothetical protein